jgi:predicted RNase H-like HicB family nuclease
VDRDQDGRWIPEVLELPGAMAYGRTKEKAEGRAKASASRAVAERLEHGEAGSDLAEIVFRAA